MAVGVSEKRVDAFEKVTGRAKYTDDMTEKNFLVAKVFRSTWSRKISGYFRGGKDTRCCQDNYLF